MYGDQHILHLQLILIDSEVSQLLKIKINPILHVAHFLFRWYNKPKLRVLSTKTYMINLILISRKVMSVLSKNIDVWVNDAQDRMINHDYILILNNKSQIQLINKPQFTSISITPLNFRHISNMNSIPTYLIGTSQ